MEGPSRDQPHPHSGDGRFIVGCTRRLPRLDPPWSYVRGHDEIGVEIIMAGNHVGLAAVERVLLRRQARQVERVEDPDAPFSGQGPVWTVAPTVPARFELTRS